MSPTELRRSLRLNTYDSNGRDYLANSIGWSRQKLESWIISPTVRPNLQLWYQVCIAGRTRFNDAVEWINTGEQGYFYNPSDLEEDLLLMCLCEGDKDSEGEHEQGNGRDGASYQDEKAKTGRWITQEVWARTAWRIVQDNREKDQAFVWHAKEHPAAAYGLVIDLLCLAFHSIAFRHRSSIYEQLINDTTTLTVPHDFGKRSLGHRVIHDKDDASSTTTVSTVSSSSETVGSTSDVQVSEPSATTPLTSDESVTDDGVFEDIGVAQVVRKWVEDVPCIGPTKLLQQANPSALRHIDEDGEAIAGYEGPEHEGGSGVH